MSASDPYNRMILALEHDQFSEMGVRQISFG